MKRRKRDRSNWGVPGTPYSIAAGRKKGTSLIFSEGDDAQEGILSGPPFLFDVSVYVAFRAEAEGERYAFRNRRHG